MFCCIVQYMPVVPRPATFPSPSLCCARIASTSKRHRDLAAHQDLQTTQHVSIYQLYAHNAEDSASQAGDESTRTQGLGCRIQAELRRLRRGGGCTSWTSHQNRDHGQGTSRPRRQGIDVASGRGDRYLVIKFTDLPDLPDNFDLGLLCRQLTHFVDDPACEAMGLDDSRTENTSRKWRFGDRGHGASRHQGRVDLGHPLHLHGHRHGPGPGSVISRDGLFDKGSANSSLVPTRSSAAYA